MHVVIGVLITVASLIYWLGMASRGAREISNLASDVKNLPRRRKFQNSASQSALDLIDEPVDAAALLMIAVARSGGDGRVSDLEAAVMAKLLATNMQMGSDAAGDLIVQLKAMSSHIVLHDSLLFPMVDILRGGVDAEDAVALGNMLEAVASTDDDISHEQGEFIRRFRERMGIGH